jgi:hypothetical protein
MHISPEQIQNLSWLEAAEVKNSKNPKNQNLWTIQGYSATQTAVFKLNPRHNIPIAT